MADDQRPPPPYAPSNDITFDWDAGSRTYGLTFMNDEFDPDEEPEPDGESENNGALHSPEAEGPSLASQRPAVLPSAFWSRLYRQRMLTEVSGEEPIEDYTTQTIPFLELPAEIRVAIYEFVCPLRGFATTFMARGSCLIPPPLAKTSRKVRSEMLPIFYGSNVFQIPMNKEHRELSFRCLGLVAPHLHLLREVRSVAPERHNSSWNVRFSMAIGDHGRQVVFTSQEPLTLLSQQSVVRVLLTSKAMRFARTFNGDDFRMFFDMLRRGTVYFEIDQRKASLRNAEHRFVVCPAESAESTLLVANA